MTNALILSYDDTVAIVIKALSKGEDVTYPLGAKVAVVKARDDIPVYHKIAVLKYGEVIGCATSDIDIGCHVHTHNLSDLMMRERMPI